MNLRFGRLLYTPADQNNQPTMIYITTIIRAVIMPDHKSLNKCS